jgi:hypothetical protein
MSVMEAYHHCHKFAQVLLQLLWHFLGLGQGNTSKFEVHTFAETTAVHFSKLSEQEIAAYIATGTLRTGTYLVFLRN